MNLDTVQIGFLGVVVPCLLVYTKWKMEKRKFEIKEKIYRKIIARSVALKLATAAEEQKMLKQETEVGEKVEYTMIDMLLKLNKSRVKKICITGGPCAGKTTGITFLSEKLKERGFAVFLVPEAATQIFMGGGMLDLENYSHKDKITFQMNLLNLQRKLEQTFAVLAVFSKKPAVLLCDRGLMDGKAYMSPNDWYGMLAQYSLNEVEMRDQRYDAVVHMVTAADSTDCYSTLNNNARHETKAQALDMDQKTQMAWCGHPKYIKIDNHSIKTFKEKLDWLLFEVLRLIGHPVNDTVFGKTKLFLLSSEDKLELDPQKMDYQIIELTNIYLLHKSKNSTLKLVRRILDGQILHYVKEKIYDNQNIIKVNNKQITKKEFAELRKLADPSYSTIVRQRTCFSYFEQHMVVDDYQELDVKLKVLKLKNSKELANIKFPPFLKIVRAIQDNEKLCCRQIAQRKDIEKIIKPALFMQFRKLSVTDGVGSIERLKHRDQDVPEEFSLDCQIKQQSSPTKSQ